MGNKAQVEAGEAIKDMLGQHAEQFNMPDLLQAIDAFNGATTQEYANWHPGLGLELAFTSYLASPTPVSIEAHTKPEPVTTKKTSKPAPETKPKAAISSGEEIKPIQQVPADPPVEEMERERADKTSAEKAHEVQESEEKPVAQAAKLDPEEVLPDSTQPEGEISIADVHKAWPTIKAMVRKHNPRTEGLLNTAKLAGFKENKLILGFSSTILKDMMEKEGNTTLTMDIIEEVLGRPVLIACIVSTHEGSILPGDLKIDQDGMVSTATRDLGGKISRAKEEK
jgi:hypothetical protein